MKIKIEGEHYDFTVEVNGHLALVSLESWRQVVTTNQWYAHYQLAGGIDKS